MKIYHHYSDEELLLKLQGDSAPVFEEIYNRYWHRLFNAAYKRIGNQAVCEEIVQDVFTKFWQNITVMKVDVNLNRYLLTAVRYSVIDQYRRYAIREHFANSYDTEMELDNSTLDMIYFNDLKNRLESFIDQLPGKCKTVYELSRLEYKSNKEIAAILKISEKTVEGHLTKALGILKQRLQGTTSLFLFSAIEYLLFRKH